MNIHHINTFILYACIWKVEPLADTPNFFCKNWKILLMYQCFVYSMFRSLGWRTQHKSPCATRVRTFFLITVCWELLLPPAVSSGHWSILLSTRLRVPDFWSWSESPTVSSGYLYFFSFMCVLRMDQRSQTPWRNFLAPRVTRPFVRNRILTSFWHGTLLSEPSERKPLKWLQENIEKLIMLNKRRRWFHWFRDELTFFDQNVCVLVFWCQHFWFGSWVPNWSCRTANQEQLCGFWTRVSSLDFSLWLSFWWQHHCLQRCTIETHLEKNVC